MVLDQAAIEQLGENLHSVHSSFDRESFIVDAMNGIEPLSITERSKHIAASLSYDNLSRRKS